MKAIRANRTVKSTVKASPQAILADKNLFALSRNPYPGRGIIVGLDDSGNNLVQVCWLMGRTDSDSRNRVYVEKDGRLHSEVADPSLVVEGSPLLYYCAMRSRYVTGGLLNPHFVSNGSQTDYVESRWQHEKFSQSTAGLHYEPDAAATPRITAISVWPHGKEDSMYVAIAVNRKSKFGVSDVSVCNLTELASLRKGYGHCTTTYAGDGNPPPTFQGKPYLVPLMGGIDRIARTFWGVLNAENKVALAVKFIPRVGESTVHIINKYKKVA